MALILSYLRSSIWIKVLFRYVINNKDIELFDQDLIDITLEAGQSIGKTKRLYYKLRFMLINMFVLSRKHWYNVLVYLIGDSYAQSIFCDS